MNFKKILGLFRPDLREPSVCESCGGEFTCGASLSGCWCVNIKLTDEIRKDLRSKFKGCLCRDCMLKIAGESNLDLKM